MDKQHVFKKIATTPEDNQGVRLDCVDSASPLAFYRIKSSGSVGFEGEMESSKQDKRVRMIMRPNAKSSCRVVQEKLQREPSLGLGAQIWRMEIAKNE